MCGLITITDSKYNKDIHAITIRHHYPIIDSIQRWSHQVNETPFNYSPKNKDYDCALTKYCPCHIFNLVLSRINLHRLKICINLSCYSNNGRCPMMIQELVMTHKYV